MGQSKKGIGLGSKFGGLDVRSHKDVLVMGVCDFAIFYMFVKWIMDMKLLKYTQF